MLWIVMGGLIGSILFIGYAIDRKSKSQNAQSGSSQLSHAAMGEAHSRDAMQSFDKL